MIIEISAAVAVLVFSVIVWYGIAFLRTAERSLRQLDEAVCGIREELAATNGEALQVLKSSSRLIAEAEVRLRAFDPFYRSVKETGEALEEAAASFKQVSAAVARSATELGQAVDKHRDRAFEIAEFASMGYQLWHTWQSRRPVKSKESR